MNITNTEIEEMRYKLKLLEKKEADAGQAVSDTKRKVSSDWWNGIKPETPLTRDEALKAYRTIEGMIKTEKNPDRLSLLRQKLIQANEKFKERKRNG